MNRERKNEGDWERWLAAETAGDAAEAEARLLALFARLDDPAPSPGFADRVVARALTEAPARRAARGRLSRAVAAGLLAAAGLAAALLLPGCLALLGLVGWAGLPALAVQALAAVAGSVGRAFADWQGLLGVLQPVARALARPPVVTALAGLALLSSLALASLARALERGKGVHHVPTFG
jgi:hypothetical protein